MGAQGRKLQKFGELFHGKKMEAKKRGREGGRKEIKNLEKRTV